MRIIVTGASGYLGGVIHRDLLRHGAKAIGTTRCGDGREDTPKVEVDLAHGGRLDALSDCLPVDAVVHAAATLPGGIRDEDMLIDNQRMTLNLARWAIEAGVRYFLQLSSCAVYGQRPDPCDELAVPRPVTLYAASKLACEHLADSLLPVAGIRTCHLRVSAPYGPHQRLETVVKRFLTCAVRGEAVTVWGTGGRTQNFVFEEDVAQAVRLALGSGAEGVFNISGEGSTSMRELADLCVSAAGGGQGARVVLHGTDPQEQHRGVYPCGKARRDLGYSPVPLPEGLSRTAAALRERCE